MLSDSGTRRCSSQAGILGILSLASLLLSLIFGPITPARAEDTPIHVPETRLQLFVKRVHIFDDRDWFGSGEFTIHAAVLECTSPEPHLELPCTASHVSAGRMLTFSADSGDDVRLNTLIAAPRPYASDRNRSDPEDLTFPVSSGKQYAVAFLALEGDGGGWETAVQWDSFKPYLLIDFEYLGTARMLIDEGNNWGVGTHSLLGDKDYGADFFVDFEIRRPALPDLVPHHVRTRQLDDGRYIICASALNRGESASGPFSMRYTWGQYGASIEMGDLSPSQVVEHCSLPDPTFGTTEIWVRVIVNPPDVFFKRVSESDFGNNELSVTLPAFRAVTGQAQSTAANQGVVTAPSSTGGSTDRSDLRPTAIRVRGADASGNNDCDPGTNSVTVVVQNRGSGAAESFTVRLSVDNDPTRDVTVDGLQAGQEREVRFNGVSLKKGSHELTAQVDSKSGVSETDEDNNRLRKEIDCKSEG